MLACYAGIGPIRCAIFSHNWGVVQPWTWLSISGRWGALRNQFVVSRLKEEGCTFNFGVRTNDCILLSIFSNLPSKMSPVYLRVKDGAPGPNVYENEPEELTDERMLRCVGITCNFDTIYCTNIICLGIYRTRIKCIRECDI